MNGSLSTPSCIPTRLILAVRVDGCVMPNKAAAIYRFTQLTTSQTYPSAPVRLPGLDPDAVYVVSPLDVSPTWPSRRSATAKARSAGGPPMV